MKVKKKTSKKGPLIFIWISPLVPKKNICSAHPSHDICYPAPYTSLYAARVNLERRVLYSRRKGTMEASAPERWLSKMLNPTLFMWNNGLGCLWNSNCNFPGKDILFSVGAYWGWGTNSCFNPTRRIPSTIQFPSWCSRPAHRHGPSSVAYHQWVP